MKPPVVIWPKRRKWADILFRAIAAAIIEAIILIWACNARSSRVVAVYAQPSSVDYTKTGKAYAVPYYLKIIRHSRFLSLSPDRYEAFIDREPGEPSYGHGAALPFALSDDDAKKCKVKWNSEGIWIDQASGHRLFIPRDAFLGGR